ncbi:rapamycin-insensitive companion of mTOR-like isoform X1 [Patiria miniata]|uniref:Rapamycin-insensitive companion of mTOR n=1 Tax=Patiria miniata TaxID=46514 RepID=A0A913ZZI2_PATMI|nr:rapamycin-insensitive companion of mTOR-like isoform X1 [Patiria miniata]
MAATMYPRRSGRRPKGRHDSGDADVPLDLDKEPADNVRDILVHVVQERNINRGRRVAYLNNFVKVINHVSSIEKLGHPIMEMVGCLRLSLLHSTKEVRSAGIRALRYLLQDEAAVEAMMRLHIDYLVMRSLDICLANDIERVQALRFIRRIIAVAPSLCPISLVHTLVAIANDGMKERDRMVRPSLETLSELAIKSTEVFAAAGGLSALIMNILDTQHLRINEAIMLTVLHLLNHPHTRKYIRLNVDIEQVIAPYTDCHYRHNGDNNEQTNEEKEMRYCASRMAIVTLIRSWPGMIRLCRPEASGLQSLMSILCIPNEVHRKYLLQVLFDIFYIPIPEWTDDFDVALQSIDRYEMQPPWQLSEGFVAEEGKAILPHRAATRTNLTENHLALILLAFTNAGLLESIVEVISSGSEHLSNMATILLGELLHMADRLLPSECEQHHHCLPTLMILAASCDVPVLQRNRASAAITHLDRLHELNKRGPVPCSLFLSFIMSRSETFMAERKSKLNRDKMKQCMNKDTDDISTQASIKETQVLSGKDHTFWNWDLISCIIKKGGPCLRKFEDANISRFFRRLVEFYKPTSKQFSSVELPKSLVRPPSLQMHTLIGCQLVEFLFDGDESEAQFLLRDLAQDIADCFLEINMVPNNNIPPEAVFSPISIQTTLSQDYFLFIGKICHSSKGEKLMEKTGMFQYILDLCSSKGPEVLQKLITTCLNCSREGLGRTILSKLLTSTSESMRLYATGHLRVQLRAQIPFFQNWGMEMLVTQLYDKSSTVASEAVEIIEEACEDDTNLHSLVQIRPSLLHMGDRGVLLLTRFLSTPKGFKYLSEVNFVTHELEKWRSVYNRKYVTLVETEINEAFTCYQKPVYEGGFVRRSQNEKRKRRDVYVPVHLYGQLVQHRGGSETLEKQQHLHTLCDIVRYGDISSYSSILSLKAALWALGHTGTASYGLQLLSSESIVPDIIRLAEECEVFSVRGTCFYVLGLFSKTRPGADLLSSLGWESVRHTRMAYFPVLEERNNIFDELGRFTDPTGPLASPYSTMSESTYTLDSPKMELAEKLPELESPKLVVENDPDGKNVFFVSGEVSPYRSASPQPGFSEEEEEEEGDQQYVTDEKSPSLAPPVQRIGRRDRTKSSPTKMLAVEHRTRMSSSEVEMRTRGISADIVVRTRSGSHSDLPQRTPNHDNARYAKYATIGHTGALPRSSILRRVATMPAMEEPGNGQRKNGQRLTKLRSNSDASSKPHRSASPNPNMARFQSQSTPERLRAHSMRERTFNRRCDSNESGRSSFGTKSRSESFATDTTQTSGISSLHSNPNSPPPESSNSSVNTITSSQTVKGIHSSDTLRRKHNLNRTPSFMRRLSKTVSSSFNTPYSNVLETSAVFTTSRDAHGYAALKALRIHRQVSGDPSSQNTPRPASIGSHDELAYHVQERKKGLLVDGTVSINSLDVILGMPKPRSNTQTLSQSHGGEYLGLCLPVDVSLIFHTDESQYRGGRRPPSRTSSNTSGFQEFSCLDPSALIPDGRLRHEERHRQADSDSDSDNPMEPSDISRFAEPPVDASYDTQSDYRGRKGSGAARAEVEFTEDTKHQAEHCLLCTKMRARSTYEADEEEDDRLRSISEADSNLPPTRPRLRGSSAASGRYTPNSADMSSTSTGSGHSSSDSNQSSRMRQDTPKGRAMIRKEVLRLVINLGSSVGMKAQEQGLLSLKEKFPSTFENVCLYSDVAYLLSNCSYRLSARRFIQELFQDLKYSLLFEEAKEIQGVVEAGKQLEETSNVLSVVCQ